MEQRTIGPTLGNAAIRASVEAAIIGGALTMLYVITYYRLLGVLAAVALLAYGVISYAVLLALNATLTLPGIAGFVLAIGMAVDANVLVFERSKEEFAAGKRVRSAALEGFKKAWSAIADSNATTLLAAIILFYFAAGAVRGFGITLTIGVLVSMFTALVVTRVLVELAMKSRMLSSRPGALGMNVGGRLRDELAEIDVVLAVLRQHPSGPAGLASCCGLVSCSAPPASRTVTRHMRRGTSASRYARPAEFIDAVVINRDNGPYASCPTLHPAWVICVLQALPDGLHRGD